MHEMPVDYVGREQTWLKHRVLQEYLAAWAHKLGSIRGRVVHLWFVDCFAGPWQSQSPDRRDTSIAIGLKALNEAAETWERLGNHVHLHAVFVEKDASAFAELVSFVSSAAGAVQAHTLHGRFGDHVHQIDQWIGTDAAFIFVDPTGWRGADMRFLAKLGGKRFRDLLVNVMSGHAVRFKDDPRAFLRLQMQDFFGEAPPPGLDERELMRFYRQQLAQLGNIALVADLAIPDPTRERTKFRLVVAGHAPAVIELFRDVEAKVIGREAPRVRSAARDRAIEARTGQPLLLPTPSRDVEPAYDEDRGSAERELRRLLPLRLERDGPMVFGALWPELLCEYHLRLTDLRTLVWSLRIEGLVEVRGVGPRQRTVKDDHVVAVPARSPE